MDLGNGKGQRRADGWGECLIDWLETRRATWVRGPGCNQFQYQGGKESRNYRNHPLCASLISVPSAASSGSWIPRQDRTWDAGGGRRPRVCPPHPPAQAGLLSNSGLLLQKEHSGRAWLRQLSNRESRKSKEVLLSQSAQPKAPGRVGDGSSWSWSQSSSRTNKGGSAKLMKVN